MKVRLTRPARDDILRIIREMPPADRQRTIAVAEQLAQAINGLSTLPRRFPVVGWTGGTEIRKQLVRPYVILFDSREHQVLIIRIVHERSDWMALV